MLACNFRLECGHTCKLSCHTYERTHEKYICKSVCNKKLLTCPHNCKECCNKCANLAGGCAAKCKEIVEKIMPDCGHTVKIQCCKKPTRKDCTEQCSKFLACGHRCEEECQVMPCGKCTKTIEVDPVCKHANTKLQVKCGDDMWTHKEMCNKTCLQSLACGHECQSKCGSCYGGVLHLPCEILSGRKLICAHVRFEKCADSTLPCQIDCKNKCAHSKCKLKCGESCIPCNEKCTNKCVHQACSNKCHEICDIEPCYQPCNKFLRCKHPCLGYCGQECPDICGICDKKKLETFSASFTLIKLVDCGHHFDANKLIQFINTKYQDLNEAAFVELPACPNCNSPMYQTNIFASLIKKRIQALEKLKIQIRGPNRLMIKIEKEKLIEYSKKSNLQFYIAKYLEENASFSVDDCLKLKEKIVLLEKLTPIEQFAAKEFLTDKWHFNFIKYELSKLKKLLLPPKSMVNSSQELKDVSNELDRIKTQIHYFQLEIYFKKIRMPHLHGIQIATSLNDLKLMFTGNFQNYKPTQALGLIKKLSMLAGSGVVLFD